MDINHFKRSVKEWLRSNPHGNAEDLGDYCESLIPANLYPSHEWLVQQTLGWFAHIQAQREEDLLDP